MTPVIGASLGSFFGLPLRWARHNKTSVGFLFIERALPVLRPLPSSCWNLIFEFGALTDFDGEFMPKIRWSCIHNSRMQVSKIASPTLWSGNARLRTVSSGTAIGRGKAGVSSQKLLKGGEKRTEVDAWNSKSPLRGRQDPQREHAQKPETAFRLIGDGNGVGTP